MRFIFLVLIRRLQALWQRLAHRSKVIYEPAQAYDQLASIYDQDEGNLMTVLDQSITVGFLKQIDVAGKTLLDVGCGTGRHWPLFYSLKPETICGYDVSAGMLAQLLQKFPEAAVYESQGHKLSHTADKSVEILTANLVIAYMPSLSEVFSEWDRVLKPGGKLLFTSNHPIGMKKGGTINFVVNSTSILIKHSLHSFDDIYEQANLLDWKLIAFEERKVDEKLKPFYEAKNALHLYEQSFMKPIIYGMLFEKCH